MDSSAAALASFQLRKVSDPTVTDLIDTTAFGVLSADKKSVTFTTNANLDPAQYVLKVTGDTKDIQNNATYKVYTGTEKYFNVEQSQLVDVVAPTLVSGAYNSETKKLTLTFDEKIKVSTINKSKIKLGGLALTNESLDTATDSSTLVFTLTDATTAQLPEGALSLALEDGAVTDVAATPNAVKAVSLASINMQTPPELIAAQSSYNEVTHQLTLKFKAPVKITALDNITLAGVALSTGNVVAPTDIATKANDTVVVTLNNTTASALAAQTGEKIALSIPVNSGIVNADGVAITQAISSDIAMTQDAAKPVLVSANYKNLDKALYLEFSEPVQVDNAIAAAKFKVAFGTGTATAIDETIPTSIISAVDANGVAVASTTDAVDDLYSKYVKIDLSAPQGDTGSKGIHLGGDTVDTLLSKLLQDNYDSGKAIKLTLDTDAVYDYANDQGTGANGNAAMTEGLTVNFADTRIPTFVTLNQNNVLSKTQLKIEFTTEMNKADVENLANYTLVNKMFPSKTYQVTAAAQDPANKKVVYLTVNNELTDEAADSATAYKLTVANMKSTAGILVDATANFEFDGKPNTAADATGPVIKTGADDGVVLTSTAGKENDTIAVQYTETTGVDKTSAENLANYSLVDLGTDGNGTTILPLTADTVKTIALSGNTATITLKTINLQKDHSYKLTVTGVKDVLGNVISTVDNKNVKTITADESNSDADGVLFVKSDTTPATATALGTVQSGKTTVTVTFNEEVDAATASQASNYRVKGAGATLLTPTSVSYDAATKKATFEVSEALTGTTFNFYVKGVKDLAGNIAVADTEVTDNNTIVTTSAADNFTSFSGVIADLVPPKFATTTPITAVANDQLTSDNETHADTITLTFDGTVDSTTAYDERNYVVKLNDVALKNNSNVVSYAGMDADNDYYVTSVSGNTVTIVLNNANGEKVNFIKGDTVSVTAANIEDAVANKMVSETVTTTATAAHTAAADGTGTDGAIATTDVVIAGPNKVTVAFADNLLNTTVSASDFSVDGNVITKAEATGAKQVTLTLAAPIQNGATVAVSGSSAFEIKDAEGNSLSKAELFGTNNSVTSAAAPALNTVNPTYAANVQVGEGTFVETNASTNASTQSFTSSNTAVATVNATTGVITPVAAGTTTISYVGKDANGFTIQTGSVIVTVYGAAATNNPTVTGGYTADGPAVTPTLTTTATNKVFTLGTVTAGSSGLVADDITLNPTTGEFSVTVGKEGEGAFVINYVGKNASGVVVDKGSVTVTIPAP